MDGDIKVKLDMIFTEEERRCIRSQSSRKKGLATEAECRAWAKMCLRADLDLIDDGGFS